MRIGLIAGNGRFPFLALEGARRLGHDVTIVAIREETSPALEAAAIGDPPADIHWISLGQLGQCITILRDAGVTRAVMAGTGQAHQALRRDHPGPDPAEGTAAPEHQEHRCADHGGGGGAGRPRHRLGELHRLPAAAARPERCADPPASD